MPSPVTIYNLPFACVPLAEANFNDIAGIYVILCVGQGGQWKVLDVGESGQLGTRINAHDREDCWTENCPNKNIWVCTYPTPTTRFSKDDRRELEAKIRRHYQPTCGER